MNTNYNTVKDFYNEIADAYAEEEYMNNSLFEISKRFVSLFSKSPCILDMGCGAGYRSKELNSFGAKVTGIDISERAIQIAKTRNPNSRFEVMDFMNMCDSLGFFDGIISVATLMHIAESYLPVVFSQIGKRLKANGYLLLIVSDGNGELQSFFNKTINNMQYEFINYFHNECLLNNLAYKENITLIEKWLLPEKYAQKGYKCYLYQKS